MTEQTPAASAVDPEDLINRSPWTAAQKTQLGLLFIAILLDGFDNLALALAIPTLALAWDVPRSEFGLVLALGLAGLTLGAVTAGPLGDRVGRKIGLLVCMLLFGGCTFAIVAAGNVMELGILRFIAGIGLGGAVPNAAALISEFTPARRQGAAVSVVALAVPAGGMTAALLGAQLLPAWGWEGLFIVAGAAPLALIPVLWLMTPESPQQLLAQGKAQAALRALKQLGMSVAEGAVLRAAAREDAPRASISALLAPAFRRDTICVWATFFCGLTVGYLFNNWIPSVLAAIGMNPVQTSQGLLFYNAGSIAGSLIGAVLITRFGSKALIATATAAAAISMLMGVLIPMLAQHPGQVFVLLFFEGTFMAALTTPIFSLAAFVYPQAIRTTGIGFAVAAGRGGAIISAFLGGIAVDSAGKAGLYFAMGGALMVGAVIALSFVGRHIPPARKLQAATS